MVESNEHEPALTALGELFVGDASVVDTLTHVAALVTVAVPSATHVGVTMIVDGRLGTHVFTHPDVAQIDRAQYDGGGGPCVDAFRTGSVVSIASTVRDDRYRDFSRSAARFGIRSTLSLPLVTHDRTVGALNLYATVEDAFDDDDRAVADQFAGQAAFVLANAQAYWDARHLSEHLRTAMESRGTIEQAKGILIGATGCSPEEAFRQLVEQSQYENVKLRDLAARLVANAQGHPHGSAR